MAAKGCPKRRFMIELKTVKCNVEEQETTIQISRAGGVIHLYTSDNTRISKMQKLLNVKGTEWKLDKTTYDKEGNTTGYFFSCPVINCFTLKAKKAKGREFTEEEKRVAREKFIKNVLKKTI